MEREYQCIQPEYLGRFQCDGTVCDSDCCRRGWEILLDDRVYERYCGMEPGVREKVLSKLRFEPKAGCHAIDLRGGNCPFLREDRLCSLQKEHGIEFLSDACAEYPRKTHQFPDIVERALCLTCPVAERLVLSAEEPMQFQRVVLRSEREAYFLQENNAEEIRRIRFFDLQREGIRILQWRKWTLDQRLALLGFFLQQADELVQEDYGAAIPEFCRQYEGDAFAQQIPLLLTGIPFHGDVYAAFQREFLRRLQKAAEDDDAATAAYMEDVEKAFPEELRGEALAARYRELRRRFQREVLAPWGTMLEQYLVNEFFISLYPCAAEGSLADNGRTFAAIYKLLEFLLMSRPEGSDPEESILRLVRWISIRTNHFVGYMDLVRVCIAARAREPSEWMALLLDLDTAAGRPMD